MAVFLEYGVKVVVPVRGVINKDRLWAGDQGAIKPFHKAVILELIRSGKIMVDLDFLVEGVD